ncbi:MAG: hypothetical protein EOO47_10940 [Flavobacterium sp.]|nr:MAG: hypothetical protein EOO47_10940 [Flavobacterium sp.]
METNNLNFMDRVAGSFKPLLILVVGLFFVGKTVVDDFEKYHKTYDQVQITSIDKTDADKFELMGFVIKEAELNEREEGGVELYENQNDSVSKATIIVDNIPGFLKVFRDKHKVIANQFEGVHQGSKKVVKEYIAIYGVKDANGDLKKILVYEAYFSWKARWWIYGLMLVAILFLLIIILSKMKVY